MSKMSREKGKRGEREWAELCRAHGYGEARRTAQYCGKTGDASDVVGLHGIHQEVKRVERLELYHALQQATRDAQEAGAGAIPVVAHRRNKERWVVIMDAEDWFKLFHAWTEAQTHG